MKILQLISIQYNSIVIITTSYVRYTLYNNECMNEGT